MRSKLSKDLTNPLNWKVKGAYFFILFGLVMPWSQLNVHQNALGMDDRDLSDFMAVSALITIFFPFASGFIGDKIGNFKTILSLLIGALGICTAFFALIPTTNPLALDCNIIEVLCSENKAEQHNPIPCNISSDDVKYSINKNTTVIDSDKLRYSYNVSNYTYEHSNLNQLIRDCHISFQISYWSYLFVRSLFTLLASACYTLFDGAVLSMTKDNQLDYGLQRAWGTLAALISSVLGGYLVDLYSYHGSGKNFSLMFYCAASSFLCGAVFVFNLDITYRRPALCLSNDLIKGFRRMDVLVLFIAILLKGIFMTYTEIFMYQYLSKMGLSHTLLGATVAVGAGLEIILQVLSVNIFKLMGIQTIIPIGILCYAIKFMGLNIIRDPKLSLALEPLDAWSSGLTDTAMYIYSTSFFPEPAVATVRGIIGSLHSGIGRLISAKVGIEIIENYGTRFSWRIMSIIALISSFIYSLFLILFNYFRHKSVNL